MKRILIVAALFTMASCETKQQKIEKQLEKLDKLITQKSEETVSALTQQPQPENILYIMEENENISDKARSQRDSLKYELELLKTQ